MRYPIVVFALIAIWVTGCDRRPVVQSEPPKSVNQIQSKILKVAVYRDGKVEVDGAAMSVEDATRTIKATAGSETSVYYYREAGEEDPHPNASKIIAAVVGANLPISLSSQPDFSTYVDENGTIRKREE
jgi:hypothetical protein